ncbi:MAG: diacylglycerol kinase family protein [Bacteroidia bacterium]|nr:diacylglycerol kinase family protein [Bacteroidia bacterium]
MKPQPRNQLSARIASFGYAFKGIRTLIASQPNARIHLLATLLVIGAGFYFEVNATEWCLLALSMGGVWLGEGVNTALEFVVDKVSPEFDLLAGKAKDVAAAAVLLMAIASATVGCIIFIPKIITLFT